MENNPLKEVKKYLLLLYKRRFLFLFTALLVMTVIAVGSFFMTKKYEATSTVFIERNMIDSLMRGITVSPSMGDRLRVLRYYMLSRDLISRTLKELDADLRVPNEAAFDALIQKYRNNTNISMRGGDLFIVSLRDEDPAFARDFVNTLVSKYVEENISEKRQEAYGANRFISEQLDYFKRKLDEAQDRIIDFRRERGIYSSVNEGTMVANINKYEDEIEQLQIQKNEMRATLETIRKQLDMMQEFSAGAGGGLESYLDGGSAGGSSQADQIEARIDDLLLTYNEQHPEIVRLRAKVEAIREAEAQRGEAIPALPDPESVEKTFNPLEDPIYVDLKMRLNAKESDLQALEARERELHAMIEQSQTKLRDIPEERKSLADLERERNTYMNLYEQLLERQGVTEVSKQMEIADKTTTFRIVDPAILPKIPVSIDRFKVMLMGILLGFASGAGLVFLIEKLDGKVKDADSITALGIPVLVQIPSIRNPSAEIRSRKFNAARYACATSWFLLVGALVVHDALGLGIVDRFIASAGIDQWVARVARFIN